MFHADGVAFITGAGGALGRAIILQFARDGITQIAGLDISSNLLSDTECALTKHFPAVRFLSIVADIADEKQVENAIQQVVERFGRLDYAVNNAAVGQPLRPTTEVEPEYFDRVISVNLKGLWHCHRYELKQMMSQAPLPSSTAECSRVQGCGAIVNVDSVLGLVAMPNLGLYTMAKHGVLGLTKTDAVDYAQHGIRINAVCPGFIDTPLLNDENRTKLSSHIDRTPMGRLARPDEVAEGISFLASDRSSYITGVSLTIDGGYTIQ